MIKFWESRSIRNWGRGRVFFVAWGSIETCADAARYTCSIVLV